MNRLQKMYEREEKIFKEIYSYFKKNELGIRDLNVAYLSYLGFSNKEIATRLGLSEFGTARAVKRAVRKLNLKNKHDLKYLGEQVLKRAG